MSGQRQDRPVQRRVGSTVPLGFAALAVATITFAALELGWVPPGQRPVAAVGVLAFAVPLQLLGSVLAFVARDPASGAAMALLAGSWAAVTLTTLYRPGSSTHAALGVILLAAGAVLAVTALASAVTKVVAAAVLGLAACRFAVTGVYQLTAAPSWQHAAGWLGVALGIAAWYAALAYELESARGRAVVPTGRRGAGSRPSGSDRPPDG
jgi:uncharacterized protein